MQWLEPRPSKRLPIRLTPLIDVVFILLLFFMLTSRLSPMGIVQLETTSAESRTPSTEELPARLHIAAGGDILWNDENIDRDSAVSRLGRYDGDRVRLSTAPSVSLSEFTEWLGEIRSHGLTPQWHRDTRPEDRP